MALVLDINVASFPGLLFTFSVHEFYDVDYSLDPILQTSSTQQPIIPTYDDILRLFIISSPIQQNAQ